MAAKKGAPTRGDLAKRYAARRSIGAWAELSFEKTYGQGYSKYSAFDILLRQEFNRAVEGDMQAVKVLLRMAKANLREADQRFEIVRGYPDDGYKPEKQSNADLACLILGIGVVDNDAVERVSGASREYELKRLKPTHIAKWVVDAALDANVPSDPSKWGLERFKRMAACCDDARFSEWQAKKAELLEELVRLRGPRSGRWQPGKSGNPRGRPGFKSDINVEIQDQEYPYDDFFLEPFTLTVGGQALTVTRLEALMHKLVVEAGKGNSKARRLLLPELMSFHEMKWKGEAPKIVFSDKEKLI